MKKIIFRTLRKLGILKYLNFHLSKKINGEKFILPIQNEVGFNNYLNLPEKWMIDVCSILISFKDVNKTFLDVGVNIGQTLLKIKSIDENIKYIGFEPNPNCITYINELLETNQFTNTLIYPVGLSNTTQLAPLQLFNNQNTDSTATLIKNFRDKNKVTKTSFVPVFKLEDIPNIENEEIGILKIDVEGGELEVIEIFEPILTSQRPLILIEILPIYSSKNKLRLDRQNAILSILKTNNYSIYRIIKNEFKLIGIDFLNEINIHTDLNLCDYLMCPSEKTETFQQMFIKEGKTVTSKKTN